MSKFKNRALHVQVLFCAAALVLIGKAMQLQLLDDSYRAKADATAIDKLTQYPSRGSIFDRNGKLLVYNIPIYDLMVTYNRVDTNMDTLKLCRLIGISKDDFKRKLNKNWRDRRYSPSVPFIFQKQVSAETYAALQESMYQFPGFFVQLRNVRGYVYPHAAHALGYLQEVNPAQIEASNGVYGAGDYIGATGVELSYENRLRGQKGYRYVLKDNLGREVGSYQDGKLDEENQAIAGQDLIASLDIELQRYCEQLMQNKRGAVVAIEPSSGEILSMLSSPSYNPNLLRMDQNRSKAYNALSLDKEKPFFNRATLAAYPPGSIFKTLVALIALQEKRTQPDRTIRCYNGYLYNGVVRPGCHPHATCRSVGDGIMHSCNAYFAELFRNIIDMQGFYSPEPGMRVFSGYLHSFGLGRILGTDFPREGKGLVPTVEYYDNIYKPKGERWVSPYIVSLGIGQGEIQMTTLQMANLACMIANRGHFYTPHLAKGFRENDAILGVKDIFRTRHYVNIDAEH
ncbi:MAG: penicillin-binding transpeptidase domain-containing protein, partial [Bacteroidota bacterium]